MRYRFFNVWEVSYQEEFHYKTEVEYLEFVNIFQFRLNTEGAQANISSAFVTETNLS